jgi:hypothetical protein
LGGASVRGGTHTNFSYCTRHYVGASVCVVGLAGIVVADALARDTGVSGNGTNGTNNRTHADTSKADPLLGDLLVLIAAGLYVRVFVLFFPFSWIESSSRCLFSFHSRFFFNVLRFVTLAHVVH